MSDAPSHIPFASVPPSSPSVPPPSTSMPGVSHSEPEINAMPSNHREPEDMFAAIDPPSAPKLNLSAHPDPLPDAPTPVGKIALIAVMVVVGLICVGGVVWYFLIRQPVKPTASISTDASVSGDTSPDSQLPDRAPFIARSSTPVMPIPVTTTPPGTSVPPPTSINASTTISVQDTDGDGLTDEQELQMQLDPKNPDTDGDGIKDQEEIERYGTNPRMADTDGDGYPDGTEISKGYNPLGSGTCPKPGCIK